MKIPHNALLLIADGENILLLRNQGDPFKPRLRVEARREQDTRPTHEQGTDAPGTAFASVGTARSSMETTDFQRQEKERFAVQAAQMLDIRARNGDFDSLIVIAPPVILAELRRNYTKDITSRLVGELDKDLTKHPIPDIEAILAD